MSATSFSLVSYLAAVDVRRTTEPLLVPQKGRPPVKLESVKAIPAEVESILDSILPPRQFQQGGRDLVQFVSKQPASRPQLRALRDLLEEKLLCRQARQEGICQVRRELYSQCLEEIIRQLTLICPDRGLLLLRIRDEFRLTLHACMVSDSGGVNIDSQSSLPSTRLCLRPARPMASRNLRNLRKGELSNQTKLTNLKWKYKL